MTGKSQIICHLTHMFPPPFLDKNLKHGIHNQNIVFMRSRKDVAICLPISCYWVMPYLVVDLFIKKKKNLGRRLSKHVMKNSCFYEFQSKK